ncbi:MAG: hypothetical protein AAB336_06930 [Acidobacteriota bacterium]
MKLCRNCNQTNPSEALFCRQCASPLDSEQQPNQQQYAPPPQQQQFGGQQQWNQPNFGNQGMQQNVASAGGGASSRAMLAAGLAAVSLVCGCGFLTGIPAAILGWLELSAIKEGKASVEGMLMAQIGLWGGIAGGIIGTVLNLIGLLILMAGGGGY